MFKNDFKTKKRFKMKSCFKRNISSGKQDLLIRF